MLHLFSRPLDVVRTLVHYFMYFILGLVMSIPGPTLIDLRQIVGTDSYGISFIFTARSIGYLFGSLIGGIILDYMKNEDIALIISSLFVALGAFTIPFCGSLPFLLITFVFTGFAVGFSNTGSNASCLRIWGRKSAPILQGLHFFYGVGGFFAPMIAASFLSSNVPSITDLSVLSLSENLTTELQSISPTINSLSNSTTDTDNDLQVIISEASIPSIAYAYLIIGGLATASSSFFFIVSMYTTRVAASISLKSPTVSDVAVVIRDPGVSFTIIVTILACLQNGLISGVEVSFAQMLTSYVVYSQHGLSKVVGSYMTCVYWATFTATRAFSIGLAWKVNVKKILMFDMFLAVSATLILLTIGTWSVTALWVGTALLGIGVASIFPGTLSWVDKYININNRITAAFNIVSSILEMTVPLCISMYLGTHPNVLFNFMVAATISSSVLFVTLSILLARKGEKYGSFTSDGMKLEEKNKPCAL